MIKQFFLITENTYSDFAPEKIPGLLIESQRLQKTRKCRSDESLKEVKLC